MPRIFRPGPARGSGAPRSFRLLFIVATSFLLLATVYTSVLIMQRQKALSEVSRYNASWLLSQAALEVARLATVVGASQIPGTNVDRDEVELWLDVVGNRVRLLGNGEVRDFIASSPDLSAIAAQFREAYASVEPLVKTLETPGHAQLILEKLAELNPKLMRLASAAYARSGELAANDLTQLGYLHWIFSGVLVALIGCGLGLTAVLFRHNRLLTQAHEER